MLLNPVTCSAADVLVQRTAQCSHAAPMSTTAPVCKCLTLPNTVHTHCTFGVDVPCPAGQFSHVHIIAACHIEHIADLKHIWMVPLHLCTRLLRLTAPLLLCLAEMCRGCCEQQSSSAAIPAGSLHTEGGPPHTAPWPPLQLRLPSWKG